MKRPAPAEVAALIARYEQECGGERCAELAAESERLRFLLAQTERRWRWTAYALAILSAVDWWRVVVFLCR